MVVPRNGVLLWGAGDLYDSSVLADRSNVPFLSLSDGVGDLGLLALVVVAVTVSGWRVPGVWRRMAPAFAIFVLADSVYLVQVAEGTYALGGLVDLGWPVAALMIGLAAQQPRTIEPDRVHNRAGILLPATSGLAAFALLVVDHFIRTNPLALGLATTSILLILVRQYLACVATDGCSTRVVAKPPPTPSPASATVVSSHRMPRRTSTASTRRAR